MSKEKKPRLKEREPYKYYRNGYIGLKSAKYLSIISPFVAIFIAKFDEYFYVVDGYKMSIGCMLAMFVGGLAIWRETKKKQDGSTGDTPISNVLGWGVAFALAFLFHAILNDLVLILGCAFAGQLAGLGFELGAENRAFYMREYRSQNIASKTFSEATKEAFKNISGKGGNAVE